LTINRQWRTSLCDVRDRRGADVGSDHQLVIGEIKLKIAAINKLNQSRKSIYDTWKLRDPKIGECFRLELRNYFQVLEDDDLEEGELVVDVNRMCNKIRDGLNEICKKKCWVIKKLNKRTG
jgi:hypothetical protein